GGDSIVSIQLVSRARAAGLRFSARDVFERKTVAALAAVATDAADDTVAELPGGGVGPVDLTPIVAAMLDQGPTWDRYGQAALITLPSGSTAEQLIAAVRALLDRHDMLRSRLRPAGDGWEWIVTEPGTVDAAELVEVVTVPPAPVDGAGHGDAGSPEASRATVLEAALQDAADRLDPAAGIMARFALVRPADASEPVP